MDRMIEIKTPLVVPARAASLDGFESLVFTSFENRTVRLYEDFNKENSEEYKKQYLYTLNFYEIFNNGTNNIKPCQRIKISEDNIVFETTIYPKDIFKTKAEMKKDGAECLEDKKDITAITDWYSLFGQGEFPFIIIRAFKLGGLEYYTYSITR
jgi:hypothetical protein